MPVLLALAGWPRFCLLVLVSDLIVGLAIGGAKSIGREVAIGLSRYFSVCEKC